MIHLINYCNSLKKTAYCLVSHDIILDVPDNKLIIGFLGKTSFVTFWLQMFKVNKGHGCLHFSISGLSASLKADIVE